MRAVWPETSVSALFGACSAVARRAISAALARPSSGAARTLAFRTRRPSASASIPSRASRPPFGVSLSQKATPSRSSLQGSAKRAVAEAMGDEVAQELQREQHDHRREVQPAEGRNDAADGLVDRLGHSRQRAANRIDRARTRVDHVEGDEPGNDEGGDDNPPIDVDDRQKKPDHGVLHLPLSFRYRTRPSVSLSPAATARNRRAKRRRATAAPRID